MEIQLFDSSGFQVRVITRNEDPWFVLVDVLKAIGTGSRTNDSLAGIREALGDGYDIVVPISDNLGREQDVTVVSVEALTFLLSRSRTEAGKKLNRWIHTEVLPAIRKTGSYSTAKPLTQSQMLLQAAQQLVEIEQRQLEQEQQQRQLQAVTVDHDHRLTAVEAEVGRYHDPTGHYYSVLGYASLNKVKLAHGDALRFGKAAAKACVQRGIAIGKIRDHRYGEVNSYPVEVLDEVFGLVKA